MQTLREFNETFDVICKETHKLTQKDMAGLLLDFFMLLDITRPAREGRSKCKE